MYVVLAVEFAMRVLNVLQGGTSPRTSELKCGSRMHVLIEGSLTGFTVVVMKLQLLMGTGWIIFLAGREPRQLRGAGLFLVFPSSSILLLLFLFPPSFLPSLHHTAAISHLLINFLRQQIMMLFSFCLPLLYSYWNNQKWFQVHLYIFHISRVV